MLLKIKLPYSLLMNHILSFKFDFKKLSTNWAVFILSGENCFSILTII